MRVVFRADASLQIGNGHIMRCLTLADVFAEAGAQILFVCREHPGHLAEFIGSKGHQVSLLPLATPDQSGFWNAHAAWLGGELLEDAQATRETIRNEFGGCDWLVIDHYALEADWERELRGCVGKILVIDDLADRHHACDLLLDQTLGRSAVDYHPWVDADCQLLCGAEYALLRSEFVELRNSRQVVRTAGPLKRLLVSMGGVDNDNLSSRVLAALAEVSLATDCLLTVVLGRTAPWRAEVERALKSLPCQTELLVDVRKMAELMLVADLAIGAAGSSAWERCCLGLPAVMVVVAENQCQVARSLAKQQAARVIASAEQIETELPVLLSELIGAPETRVAMSRAATQVTDGGGVSRVLELMGI
jgi:UDP-2,4-diacetamido-2,4,6-trideoxy-beta-L-altropyranose hydrolase